jgi:hypothetical protein
MRTRMPSAVAAVFAAGTLLGWLATGLLTTDVRAQEEATVQKSPAGFPALDEVSRVYDEADFNRAVQSYRFFYSTVAGAAIFKGNIEAGLVENKVFGVLDTEPRHVGFTLNSDTPYSPIQLNLRGGFSSSNCLRDRSSARPSTSTNAGSPTWAFRGRTRARAASI